MQKHALLIPTRKALNATSDRKQESKPTSLTIDFSSSSRKPKEEKVRISALSTCLLEFPIDENNFSHRMFHKSSPMHNRRLTTQTPVSPKLESKKNNAAN